MNRSELALSFSPTAHVAAVEWVVSPAPVAYDMAVSLMDLRVEAIARDEAAECVWLLEHPPLYTAGTSARAADLLDPAFPVFQTGRGGQYTYHGPGQRVAYVMLDLKRRKPDLRAYVATLETWVIATLADLGIDGERREDRVGVWVRRPDLGEGREDKIAALGIRLRRWISLHGVSINVAPDLTHFGGIVPCGLADPRFGVTSLRERGLAADLPTVDRSLRRNFVRLFGPTVDADRRSGRLSRPDAKAGTQPGR